MNEQKLADLIDISAVQKMANAHYRATGIPIGIIDAVDNTVLVGAGWQDICLLFHRVNPETRMRCEESDNFIKANLAEDTPCQYRCLNGLWDIGMPIIVAGRHLATMFLGQFIYEGEIPDRQFFIDQARQFNFPEDEYLAALDKVPVFSREKVQTVLEYDTALMTFIADLAEKTLQQRQAEDERQKLEVRLQHAQKMESIGRLAGGVAHDFNNMLGVIIGQTELTMARLSPEDRIYADLQRIYQAAEHSAQLTRQLLAFARKQLIRPKIVNLTEAIASATEMLKRLVGEDIELNWLPAEDLWPVEIDPGQLDQILANLCVNARDAITGGGVISIEAVNTTIDDPRFAGQEALLPGDYVRISVSDTGCGMDETTLAHSFEPFFTTKGTGEGTGLGLSTVYGIVTQNKGAITVYSEPGKGTIFRIYLPRHQGGTSAGERPRETQKVPSGRETILLVEDDQAILEITANMLRALNYSVLTADRPEAALEIARNKGTIHLLLTDVIMPEMNGPELARRLRACHPECRVMFVSGYTANIIGHHGVLHDGIHFLQKPFTFRELAERLRQALAAPLSQFPFAAPEA